MGATAGEGVDRGLSPALRGTLIPRPEGRGFYRGAASQHLMCDENGADSRTSNLIRLDGRFA